MHLHVLYKLTRIHSHLWCINFKHFLYFPFLLHLLLYLPQCISLVVLGREERGKRERREGEKLRLFYSKLRHVHVVVMNTHKVTTFRYPLTYHSTRAYTHRHVESTLKHCNEPD